MGERPVPLDPQLQAMRDQRERDNVPPLYAMSLAEARAADLASIRASGGEPEHVHEVTNLTIPGPGGDLPLRLYRPASARPLPVLLYFFGGGWVLGTIDTADGVSRSLANSSGALVAVVGSHRRCRRRPPGGRRRQRRWEPTTATSAPEELARLRLTPSAVSIVPSTQPPPKK